MAEKMEKRVSILVVEDDLTFSTMLKTWLGKQGFRVDTAGNLARARKLLEEDTYDLVLTDLRLPDEDGTMLLPWMKRQGKQIPLIIMTRYADVRNAVEAMKSGACDYIAKPVQPDELLKKIREALRKENTAPRDASPATARRVSAEHSSADKSRFLEGRSEAARQLYNYVSLVAPTPMSVLINGASGTGKEYVAHRIHQLSKRAEGPFVAIDCGSVPRELAASEFFGHVKGAFTGALTDKTGAFAQANGGTLFLDEIGNLSYEVQVQLLRALQERRIRPVGSDREMEVDVRLISATNENLPQAIEKGNFREDLFHRINEFTLRMPALKDRQEDILLFATFFLEQANSELDRQLEGFDAEASAVLQRYSWPGNLRQLKNVVKRAALLAQGRWITAAELDRELWVVPAAAVSSGLSLHSEADEQRRILEALRQAGNNKSKAAILLGIDRKTLYNKMKLYGLS